MVEDSRSRKWQITINNPLDKGFTHDCIVQRINSFKSILYYCISDEVGENGTFHTHIYMVFSNATRFSTLLKAFEGGHFEMAKGTSQQNRDYVFKVGKWLNSEKNCTNIADTHIEWGEIPIERQGQRNDIVDLYDMIKAGLSNYDIIESNPTYMLNIDKIDRTRQIVVEEKYKNERRNLDVTYIFGTTGSGKTRSVMDKYGYSNVYRVIDYLHPWDSYKGQDIVVFEEFRSSASLGNMLNWLDCYPVELACRYSNKVACYTKVFIISNIDLTKQYPTVQNEEPETYKAFLRRINRVKVFTDYKVFEYDTTSYLSNFTPCVVVPFDKDKIQKISSVY